jgi:hypothetical protein
LRQLPLTTDERSVLAREIEASVHRRRFRLRSRSIRRSPRATRLLAQDLPVELPGVGFGFCTHLSFEDGDTELVLPERRATPAMARIQAHQRAVDGLL